ncbi:hypothetical protein SDC9_170839 [bioreactor metagenome]|uniref:Uncharacterized protein n=1 Tax=bioreactor metagenome TaxID=1076179 RepID=A0A645G962_9ZZZZ
MRAEILDHTGQTRRSQRPEIQYARDGRNHRRVQPKVDEDERRADAGDNRAKGEHPARNQRTKDRQVFHFRIADHIGFAQRKEHHKPQPKQRRGDMLSFYLRAIQLHFFE